MKTLSHIRTKAKITPSSCLSWILFHLSVTALYFIVSSTNAHAGQVTCVWDKNTEPDLAGYKIYYGNSSRNYSQSVNITSPNVTTWTISDLSEGQTYYFAATAYNTSLIESNYSAEVFCTINSATTTIQPTTSSSTLTDFNGDGKTDLVWRNQSTGAIAVWLMDGTTILSGEVLTPVSDTNWQIVGP